MMGRKLIGIDFGTSAVKIYRRGAGIVLNEKNAVAIQNRKKVAAVGTQAYDMLGKAPEQIVVASPIRNGVIADIGRMQIILNHLIERLFKGKVKSADYVIAVPKELTEVEKRAFFELVQRANVKMHSLYIVDKPIAAALGMEIDISKSHGVLTVDFGADTTEIAVISMEGIVVSKLIPIGGYKLDALIQSAVKRKHNLLIGEKSAEQIKIELASAIEPEKKSMRVFGRDVVSGLPAQAMVDSELVYYAIRDQLSTVLSAIRQILERTPPEISADIIESGIYVAGGTSHIQHLAKRIEDETNLKVNIASAGEHAVINGLGVMIENHKLLRMARHMKK